MSLFAQWDGTMHRREKHQIDSPCPPFTEMAYYQMWFMLVVRLELPFEKTVRALLCSSFGRQADGFKRTCLRGMECARLMSYLLGPALVLLELC